MKTDRLAKYLRGFSGSLFALFGRSAKTEFSNPRRYRLDFIAENTFNRVWTVRFGRARVILVSLTIIAAIAALMFVIVFFSPVRKLLPGRLEGNLRSSYVDMALRLDSLETQTSINDRYIANLKAVLSDTAAEKATAVRQATTVIASDSLLSASEAERRFVRNYEAENRFNLSVLTPIAAESMAFYSPVAGVMSDPEATDDETSVAFIEPGLLAVSSVYRGTVLDVYETNDGLRTVIIQHPNDFVSFYKGLSECFVAPGKKVLAGERIGHSGNGKIFTFQLWHNGAATTPTDYIAF